MGSEKHACLLPFPLSSRAMGHLCHLKRHPLKRTSRPLSSSAMAPMGKGRGQGVARTEAGSAFDLFHVRVCCPVLWADASGWTFSLPEASWVGRSSDSSHIRSLFLSQTRFPRLLLPRILHSLSSGEALSRIIRTWSIKKFKSSMDQGVPDPSH